MKGNVLPSGPVEVATCVSKSNRVGQRDLNEGPIGSPRDSSTRLWRRPIVPPSAYPVPTEYPKFQLDYTSVSFRSHIQIVRGVQRCPASTTRLRSFAKFEQVIREKGKRKINENLEKEEISLTLVPMAMVVAVDRIDVTTYKAMEKACVR